jgi:apolipoprotein N-acyltransferase
VLGVLGVSLLTVLTGAALWALWVVRGRGAPVRVLAAALGVAWFAGAGLARVEWSEPEGAVLDVALVQGAIPQAIKWRPETRQQITDRYLELSARHADADLLLWPEAALTIHARDSEPFLERLGATLAQRNATLVLGLPDYDIDPANPRRAILRNTAIAIGAGEGRYVKQRLVPFGEYVPLEGLIRGVIEFFDMPMSRARPGPAGQAPLVVDGGVGMSMAICYEVAYGGLVRELSRDAGLLATISNDTWFGDSIGPSQHMQMAQMRALELGRPMLRSTNDGITALVDHRGRIVARLPRFEPGVLRASAQPRQGLTPYARFGSTTALCLAFLLLLPALRARRAA